MDLIIKTNDIEKKQIIFQADKRINDLLKKIACDRGRTSHDIRIELIYSGLDFFKKEEEKGNILLNRAEIFNIINNFSIKYKDKPITMKVQSWLHKTLKEVSYSLSISLNDLINLILFLGIEKKYSNYNINDYINNSI